MDRDRRGQAGDRNLRRCHCREDQVNQIALGIVDGGEQEILLRAQSAGEHLINVHPAWLRRCRDNVDASQQQAQRHGHPAGQ